MPSPGFSLHKLVMILTVVGLFSISTASQGQSLPIPDMKVSLKLPSDLKVWINSPPLTMDMLKGKGAVFYMFEMG